MYLSFRQFLYLRESFWEFVSKVFGAVGISAYMVVRIRQYVNYQIKENDDYSWVITAETINQILIQMTFFFFVLSYLRRSSAKERARGVREILIPLICAGLPLLIWEIPDINYYITKYAAWIKANEAVDILMQLSRTDVRYFDNIIYLSMPLLIIGHIITLSGILWLGKSFSIMSEARDPVFTGPYKYIRHPLYLGESIAVIGVFLERFCHINIFMTILFLVMQRYRAYIEEKKLIAVYPEYKKYKEQTGAYWPEQITLKNIIGR